MQPPVLIQSKRSVTNKSPADQSQQPTGNSIFVDCPLGNVALILLKWLIVMAVILGQLNDIQVQSLYSYEDLHAILHYPGSCQETRIHTY